MQSATLYLPPQLSTRFVPIWRRNLLVWRKLAIASILGNIAAAVVDPINLASMAVGVPEAAGVLGTFLRVGAISGGSQFAISSLTAPLRREVGLPVDILRETEYASPGGGVVGGSVATVASMWRSGR